MDGSRRWRDSCLIKLRRYLYGRKEYGSIRPLCRSDPGRGGNYAFVKAGFRPEDISVLFPDNEGTKDFAHEKNTKAPEGAATGVGAGGAIGGTLGLLVGIGALAIPVSVPSLRRARLWPRWPAWAREARWRTGGALVGMGIPEYEAKRYDGRVRKGGILLSVHCDNSDWVSRAKDILKQTGAEDISSAGESGRRNPTGRLIGSASATSVTLPRTRTGGGTL